MTRRLLSVTMALGLLVTAIGFGGIFAVFADRATTGSNSVISDPLPSAADIQIQTITLGGVCADATYMDDLLSTLVNWTDARPGGPAQPIIFCIRNVGTAALTIDWSVTDLVDVDLDCTGDEGAIDLTCGVIAGQLADGELAEVLLLSAQKLGCVTPAPYGNINNAYLWQLGAAVTTPVLDTGGSLAPGAEVCLQITTSYPDYDDGTSVDEGQAAQSDQATWRYAFNATTQ